MIEVREGGLDDARVQDLLAYHHREAHRRFPSEFAHALPPAALNDPAITFFAAWEGETLLGIAALKQFGDGEGGGEAEVKSMRTHPDALGRGVGRALLARVIAKARAQGLARVSLETGTTADFAAAARLYESAGFTDCAAFGDYPPSAYNRFMTLALT